MLSNSLHTRTTSGFGLIELLVSMSIMALVSAIVLVNQNSFNSAVVLRNQAYEVAFMLRQAQLAAVSGTGDQTSDGQRFGVRIDRDNNSVIFFRDMDDDGLYTPGPNPNDDIILEQRRLDNRFQIDTMSIGSTNNVPVMHVVFERPNFDALLYAGAGSSRNGPAVIEIGNVSNDATRRIEITNSGNISVLSN